MIKTIIKYVKETPVEEFYTDMIKWSIMTAAFLIILGLLD